MKRTQIIETTIGKVRGYIDEELEIFKGIPYAEHPVGELRFKRPIPKKKWIGIHEALDYGPICVQNLPGPDVFPDVPQSESHSLTLNIWTPKNDDKKRAVMVRIHGGGLNIGSGRLSDGFMLARRGNIVVVTLNYRLGPLGYFVLPGEEINVGMLDQIEALKWIHNNIEKFGGDPENVTIFGISAGGWSVSTLMAVSEAKGLFKRVIAQSGALHPASFQTEKKKEITQRIMKELKIEYSDVESYRKISPSEIYKAYTRLLLEDEPKMIPFILGAGPFIDDTFILVYPLKRIKSGFASDIDLLVGTTLEEAKFWAQWDPSYRISDENDISKRIVDILNMIGVEEKKAMEIFEIYKQSRDGKDIIQAFMTDFDFRISAIRLAESQSIHNPNTYMYLFDYELSYPNGKIAGAVDGADSGFTFGSLHMPNIVGGIEESKEAQILAEQHMDCWISFAKNGNPNHSSVPVWPVYNVKNRATMMIGKDLRIIDDPNENERAAWDGILTVD